MILIARQHQRVFRGVFLLTTVLCAGLMAAPPGTEPQPNVLDFTVRTIDGDSVSLRTYEGDVLLIVNVASRCGFTSQYAGLETLQREYGGRGLKVLGFPANDFGGQEPGTAAEIKEFCTGGYFKQIIIFDGYRAIRFQIYPYFHFWCGDRIILREDRCGNAKQENQCD